MTATVLAALAVAGPAAAAPLARGDIEFIDRTVAQQMAAQGIPGVTVSVTAPGRKFLRSYGLADTATGQRLTPQARYRIASVTKSFTATAILQLVDRKQIRLSDKLEKYVKGVPNGSRITIKQLLGMRAGVFNWVEDPAFLSAYNADPLFPGWRPQDVIPVLQRNADKAKPPGRATVYSDSNYVLLGLVLEEVTGRTAERFIDRWIVKPLGLRKTTFPTTPALPAPFAHGYDDTLGQLRDASASNPKVPWAAGGMVSNVPDMTRYARALATGELLGTATQRRRVAATSLGLPSPFFVGYGLGITKIGKWIGHDGSIFGYSNFVFHFPAKGATIVVMVNRGGTTNVLATETWVAIARHLYPASFGGGR